MRTFRIPAPSNSAISEVELDRLLDAVRRAIGPNRPAALRQPPKRRERRPTGLAVHSIPRRLARRQLIVRFNRITEKVFAYLISVGIVVFGCWIIFAMSGSSGSGLMWLAGSVTLAVGVLSFSSEIHNAPYARPGSPQAH
jgi:hypothetical protein